MLISTMVCDSGDAQKTKLKESLMTTSIHWLSFVFIMVITMSCKENQENFSSGIYSYSGYDLDGVKTVAGELTLTVVDSRIEGDKDIKIVGFHLQYIDEAGVGPIGGQIDDDGKISVYLLEAHGPYMMIRGKYTNGVLIGKRYWGSSGGAPEVVIGTFNAKYIE